MENVSKALLMAGGMLMAILVISMLILMYTNINSYFSASSEANRQAQIVKFNEEYESYNRKDDPATSNNEGLRGTEIISLLAKANEYNTKQSDYDGTSAGYSKISITVDIGNENLKKFTWDGNTPKSLGRVYTDSNYTDLIQIKTNCSKELSDVKKSLVRKNSISDSDLETLAGALANLTNDKPSELERKKRYSLLGRIFAYEFNDDNWKLQKDKIYKILNSTQKYYEYTQFKKAHFDCIDVSYKTDAGKESARITGMEFKFNGTIE